MLEGNKGFVAICILSCVILGFSSFADAAQFTLKLGHGAAPDNPRHLVALDFAKDVEQKTGGAVTIKVFPSESLGSDRQMLESVVMGGLDMSVNSQGPVAGYNQKLNVVGLPFLFSNPDQVYRVLDGEIGGEISEELESKGFKVLAYWENGFRHITNNVQPITVPEDLKGLKIRTPEDNMTLAIFKALGANPAPFAFGELYMALKQGQFDGQENPITNIYYSKIYEVQKYLSLSNHKYETCPLVISMVTWNRLPKEFKEIIKSSAMEFAQKHRKLNTQTNSELLAELEKNGVIVNSVNVETMRKATQSVYTDFEPVFGNDLIQKVLSMVEK